MRVDGELTDLTRPIERDAQIAMGEMATTLKSLDAVLHPDSATQYELRGTLESLQQAAESIERLGEKLNQKPNALIFGDQ